MMNVIVLAGVFLFLEKTGAHLVEEGVSVGEEGVDGVGTCVALLIRQQHRRRAAVDDGERRCTERGVERRVVAVLRPWKPIQPVPRSIAGGAM
jgi:hypothetical protein